MPILTNVRLFTGGLDLTGVTNKVEFAVEREEKDVTTFLPEGDPDSGWKKVTGGLAAAAASAEGFNALGANEVDEVTWTGLGGLDAWTAAPVGAAVGATCWVMRPMRGNYQSGGGVGDVLPWSSQFKSDWPAVRGQILHSPATARTATGNGTGVLFPSVVAAGQYLFASLHVLSVAGTATPTITVTIQSDSDNTFASTATQLTFAPATAVGGQVVRALGPVTDTWYRAHWTITGTSPSFLFVIGLGVF